MSVSTRFGPAGPSTLIQDIIPHMNSDEEKDIYIKRSVALVKN